MNGLDVIVEKIAFIAIFILVGFLCEKTGYVKNITTSVSSIITKITLPAMIIVSVSANELDSRAAMDGAKIFIFALCAIGFMMISGLVVSKIFKLDEKKKGIQLCMGSFGNVAFLGFPLLKALFGDEGLLYAAFYSLANDGLLWTLGLGAISGEKGMKKLKNMLNPCTFSFAIAIALLLLHIRPQGLCYDVLNGIGVATTPLSMFFIGATMARADIISALKSAPVYILAVTKLLVVPCILIFVLSCMPTGFMAFVPLAVLIIQAAMPSQTLFAILAKEYDLDEKYAVEVIFVTTLLSPLTLPLVYRLICTIFI